MRSGKWRAATGGQFSILAATLSAGLCTPAAAEICDLKVYDAHNTKRMGPADTIFHHGEQFMVCFKPLKDGYVSLWDRMPQDAPVERLGPSQVFEAEHKARKVKAGETQCFGDGAVEEGAEKYVLVMDIKDGFGLGRMWLVFSDKLEDHPDQAVFDSVFMFKDSYERRFGAGAIEAEPGGEPGQPPKDSGCTAAGSLEFDYRVVTGE